MTRRLDRRWILTFAILAMFRGTTAPLNAAPTTGAPVPKTGLSEQEMADGWIGLFDGTSLYGWTPNSSCNWTVSEGVIKADAGKPGLLVSTFELADYEFRGEYRLEKGGNSGIFLRTPLLPTDPAKDCYEFNMCDSHPAFPTGSIVGRKAAAAGIPGEEEWRPLFIRIQGPRIEASINGRSVIDFTDPNTAPRRAGHIGLQMNGGAVEFRHLAMRPLGDKPLFDGRDLAGWHAVPGSKSRFDVVDGTIRLTNGPGFLETDQVFGDFVLRFDARTNGKLLNSGIFFRAMRGTAKEPSNGYELQIHNGFKHGDRTDPVDAGTGAIYRRTKARWVIPDDGSWFTGTLIVNGDHVSCWIDGVQVTDWRDPRRDDPNPRRGRRLQPGHLLLQGHDATTNLNFRRLEVVEIPRS